MCCFLKSDHFASCMSVVSNHRQLSCESQTPLKSTPTLLWVADPFKINHNQLGDSGDLGDICDPGDLSDPIMMHICATQATCATQTTGGLAMWRAEEAPKQFSECAFVAKKTDLKITFKQIKALIWGQHNTAHEPIFGPIFSKSRRQ